MSCIIFACNFYLHLYQVKPYMWPFCRCRSVNRKFLILNFAIISSTTFLPVLNENFLAISSEIDSDSFLRILVLPASQQCQWKPTWAKTSIGQVEHIIALFIFWIRVVWSRPPWAGLKMHWSQVIEFDKLSLLKSSGLNGTVHGVRTISIRMPIKGSISYWWA